MGPEAATAGRGAEVTPRQPGMALAAKRDQMDALRRKEEYGRAPRMRAVPFNNAVRRQVSGVRGG